MSTEHTQAHDQDHPVPDQHGVNLYDSDPDFARLLPLYLPAPVFELLKPKLQQLGGLAGGVLDTLAQTADKNPPELIHRTRSGIDAQSIVKHPAYVEMERYAFSEYGLAAMSHRAGVFGHDTPLPAAAKYALTYLFVQAEFGLCCPLSMTDSLTRTLRKYGTPELIERYLPMLTTQVFDDLYQGAMFMTEQGAGSDVGATATTATPDGDAYKLYGDKWFCSNPDAGLAMVLARIDGAAHGLKGVSLFLLPRTLPDGSTLDVKIPPGLVDGQTLRLKGKGAAGAGKGGPGDALIEVEVLPDRRFTRDGDDISLEVPISLSEAVLGAKIPVPTPTGNVTMSVPKGSNTGTTLRLKGKGAPRRGGGNGDQFVRLKVVLPKSPDPDLEAFVSSWSGRNFNPREERPT